jgi:hypothetical protein
MTQTFATVAQNILSDATQKNMTAKEISMQLVKNSPKRQSLIKEFLILSNKTAPVGTAALLIEAGNLILDQCNLNNVNITNLLSYPTNNLPSRYRSQKFYNLATGAPAAFLACLIYATDSESGFTLKDLGKKYNEAKDRFGNWLNEKGEDATNAAKEIGLAPARGAFLLLLKVNFRNLAARLTNYDKQFPSDKTSSKLKEKWENLGGDWAPLITTARENANKKPLLGAPKNFIGPYSNLTGAEIGTAAAASIPIINEIKDILKDAFGDDILEKLKEEGIEALKDKGKEYLEERRNDRKKEGGGNFPEIGSVKTPFGTFEWGLTNNKAVLTGLALAVVAVIAIFYFSKKK